MLVLLVEDDMDLAELVIEYLEAESIQCDIAYNGVMGLNLLETNQYQYDVMITDIMMPKMDGYALCDAIRNQGVSIPCLMLTARDQLEDKLLGFDKGADDYLVKPFELAELVARIRVLARRQEKQGQILQVGDLVLNSDNKTVLRNGKSINLSHTEWKLLEYLMRQSPTVVSRQQIEEWVWPDEEPSKDAYKMLVYRLRKAIDSDDVQPLLHTIRGRGLSLREAISNE